MDEDIPLIQYSRNVLQSMIYANEVLIRSQNLLCFGWKIDQTVFIMNLWL